MKKNKGMAYAVLGTIFIVYNVLVFVIPIAKTNTFWVAYCFTLIALAVQIAVWRLAFNRADTLKSKFLGIPLIHIGIVYLIIQLIASAVFMAVPTLPTWLAVVVSTVILGIAAICLIAGEVGRDEIERVEEKVNQKVFYIKSLQADIELLAEQETDERIKAKLTKLAESFRFSDPMSNAALAGIEAEIADKVEELKTAKNKLEIVEELKLLLAERNKETKL